MASDEAIGSDSENSNVRYSCTCLEQIISLFFRCLGNRAVNMVDCSAVVGLDQNTVREIFVFRYGQKRFTK